MTKGTNNKTAVLPATLPVLPPRLPLPSAAVNLTHQVITVPGTLGLPGPPGTTALTETSQQLVCMGTAWTEHGSAIQTQIRGDKLMCLQSIYIIGRQE